MQSSIPARARVFTGKTFSKYPVLDPREGVGSRLALGFESPDTSSGEWSEVRKVTSDVG